MILNPINAFGLAIIAAMLAPGFLFRIRQRGLSAPPSVSRIARLAAAVGSNAAAVLMVVPLAVGEFGFHSVEAMLVYVFGNGALLAAHFVVWATYFKKPSRKKTLVLASLHAGIFLVSGITLHHWLLVAAAVLFGSGRACTVRCASCKEK